MLRLEHAAKTGLPAAALVAVVLVVWFSIRTQPAVGKKPSRREPLPSSDEIARLPVDGGEQFNRLIHEKSPYLLQHARNPVDWYPWGPEAFARARKENKPVFLSVGYSTCHWCHVMEHESFERQDVAEILNKHFVAIKVDREERPDVDQIYMLATQVVTGRGGWPNSLWLTPDGKPWYAGTYFPREDRSGRPGFKTVLRRLAGLWRERRKDVLDQADKLAKALKEYSSAGRVAAPGKLSFDLLEKGTQGLRQSYDAAQGGFSQAPKFPPHSALRLLFYEHRRTRRADLQQMAARTLDAMARGGIYDHIGGGFHRYSTDAKWLVPHFEKMLYDNAQLIRAYVDGFLATGSEAYRQVVAETAEWVFREMTDSAGGFYSALDADSEGEEGKFYLWTRREILDVLGRSEGELFCGVYNVTEEGNYHDEAARKRTGTNILHLTEAMEDLATRLKVDKGDLHRRLAAARKKLLARREGRIRPYRDDKVLVSWNALMIGSLAYAGRHLQESRYVAAAEKAADFILTHMRKDGRLLRTYRRGHAKLNAYLDDYAFLADALLDLHEATGRKRWLKEADSLTQLLLKHFHDPADGGFFFTSGDHENLLARTKDPMDRAIPAGNAVAAGALVRLAGQTGRTEPLAAAGRVLERFHGHMDRMPQATAAMLLAAGAYLEATASAAASQPAGAKPDAVAGKPPVALEAFVSPRSAAPGEVVDVAIRVTIDKGWHINSNKPLQKHLIPTSVHVEPTRFAALHRVVYPEGKKAKFAFSKEALSVYEGVIRIRAKVRIDPSAGPGPVEATVAVKTQACNDSSCLAPETHVLSLRLVIEGKPDS